MISLSWDLHTAALWVPLSGPWDTIPLTDKGHFLELIPMIVAGFVLGKNITKRVLDKRNKNTSYILAQCHETFLQFSSKLHAGWNLHMFWHRILKSKKAEKNVDFNFFGDVTSRGNGDSTLHKSVCCIHNMLLGEHILEGWTKLNQYHLFLK